MSWRRFQTLVKGLSPGSTTVSRLNATHYIGGKRPAERVNTVVGPKAAQAAFEAAFKPPGYAPPKRRKRARPTRI